MEDQPKSDRATLPAPQPARQPDVPHAPPASTPSAISAEEITALSEFRYVIRKFLAASERMAQQTGLTPQQHQLLLAIQGRSANAAPTIGYLAERLLIKHHSAVGLVDRLVEEGLVVREVAPHDRRHVLVCLTDHGRATLDRLSSAHRQEIRSLAPRLIEALGAIVETHGGAAT